jgi:betaine-aldehyde dehydrogenase
MLGYPTMAAGVTRREPIGVVAGIVPWNFPMLLAVWKLGPALAAGNCIVLKTDEKTPATLLEVARAAHEAGVPPGVLNVITGEGEEVGRRLSAHPDVRKIAFTGSTAVGRLIAQQASENIKKVTLELGGKGPNIVLADADIDTAVDGALFAFCLYQGQACESGTRLLLPDSLHDEFVAKMIERAKLMKVGDPTDFDTDMGPVISAEQKARIESYLELAPKEGATIAFQGDVPDGPGHWIPVTILTDVTNDMRVAQEEIFGPVLSVVRAATLDAALEVGRKSPYGNGASIFTRDGYAAREFKHRFNAGMIGVNVGVPAPMAWFPFTGWNQSFFGDLHIQGTESVHFYTRQKMTLTRWFKSAADSHHDPVWRK